MIIFTNVVGTAKNPLSLLKCNQLFFALPWEAHTGGSLAIRRISNYGRFVETPKLILHSQVITDFEFYPFNDRLLASSSMDSFVKLWELPEDGELTESLRESKQQITTCSPCNRIFFHPMVSQTLITAHRIVKFVIY